MTTVCIHQPDFAPHLGFFDRLKDSDVFVVLDNVQFLRRGWHHRDKIRTRHGAQWLSLSVKKGDYNQTIDQVFLADEVTGWKVQNLNLISENYRHAPAFATIFPALESLYHAPLERLVDFNMAFIRYFLKFLGIAVDIRFASEIAVHGERTDRLVNLVRAVNGTRYLTGTGSRSYLEIDKFAGRGIAVEMRPFRTPVYRQQFEPFIPDLSVIDLAFNCGAESVDLLESARALVQ